MTSIFDFVKQGQQSSSPNSSNQIQNISNSSIFEVAKGLPVEKERTRIQSLTAAPVKGLLKGLQETYGSLSTGPIPGKLAERAIEETFPTEKKAAERFLERGGKVASYLAGPGALRNKLIRGGLATVGGQLAEEFGLGKGAQSTIEIGALLSPTSLKGAQKHISSLYSKAEKALPKGADVQAGNLKKNIHQFIKGLRQGGTSESKTKAMTKAKEVLTKIHNGQIDVKELTEFKKSINEARAGLYVDRALEKTGRAAAKRNLDTLSSHLESTLEEYGKKNPQWYEPYKEANEGYSAIAKSKKVSNWITRVIKQHPHASGAAFAGTLIGHSLNPKSAIGLIGGAAALKTGEFIARIAKSKVLRKYYTEAIKQAVKESPSGFLNAMKKLSENFEKEKTED